MRRRWVQRREVLKGSLVTAGLGAVAGCLDWVSGTADGVGTLTRLWVSNTRTEYCYNHHGIAVVDLEDGPIVGAPINDKLDAGPCAVVALDADGASQWREPIPDGRCNVHALGDVGVGDLTGDGRDELLVPHEDGRVVAHRATDGSTVLSAEMVEVGYSAPRVVPDPDGPGAGVAVAGLDGRVAVASADGEVRWRERIDGGSIWTPVLVGSFTGAGRNELAVNVGPDEGELVIFGSGGEERRRLTFPRFSISWAAVGRDGVADVVLADRSRTVRRFDVERGEERWHVGLSGEFVDVGAVTDERVFVGDAGGAIHALDRDDGSIAWSKTPLEDRVFGPVLARPVADGPPVVVTISTGGDLVALDAAGGEILTLGSVADGANRSPVTADLTGDGTDDVAVLHGDGRIGAYAMGFDDGVP